MKYMVPLLSVMFAVSAVEAKPMPKVSAKGEIMVEAEKYTRRRTRGKHKWERVRGKRKDIPNHLLAGPSANKVFDLNNADFEKKTPSVEFDVQFEATGTFYLWVKGKGTAGGASMTIGVDNELIQSDYVGFFPRQFGWLGKFSDGSRIAVEIESKGKHTLHMWMIEDGVRIDKLLITSDENYDPDGPGKGK